MSAIYAPWRGIKGGGGASSGPYYTYQAGTPLVHYKFNEASGALVDYGSAAENVEAVGSPTYRVAGPGGEIAYGISNGTATARFWDGTPTAEISIGTDDFTIVIWTKDATSSAANQGAFQFSFGAVAYLIGYYEQISRKFTIDMKDDDNTRYTFQTTKAAMFDVAALGWTKLAILFDRSATTAGMEVNNAAVAVTDVTGTLSGASGAITLAGNRGMLCYTNADATQLQGSMAEFWLSTGLTYT